MSSAAQPSPPATVFLESERCLPVMKEARSPFTLLGLAKWLTFAFVVTLVFVALVPWQQNVAGSGVFSAYAPLDRRQTIQAPVSGRVVSWSVTEGTRVARVTPSSKSPTTIQRS